SEINNTNNLTGDVVTSDGTNLTNSLLTKVYKCNNTGNITAKTLVNGQDLAAGGIVGQINSEKTETPALMSIEMSYNTGAIKIEGYTSNSAYGGIGGIVGETTLNCGKVFICQTYNAGTLNNTNTMDRGDTPAKVKIGGISGRGGLMFASEELADNETAQSFFLASTGLLPVGSALVGEVTWATGLSSANMKQKSSYIVENEDGWNFSTVWVLEDDSIIYPTLYSSYENKNFYYDNNNYTLKTRNDTQLSSNITVPAEINGCVVKSFIVTDYNLIGTINFAISSSLVAVLFEEPNCYANLLSTDAGLPNFTNNINATNLQNIYVPDLFGTFASNRIKLEAKGWESSKVLFYSEALVFSSDGFIGAKSGLTSLTAIILPTKINGNLMTKISTDAFKGFLNLTTIVLTEKTTILGTSSFEDCSSLVSIYIPSSVLTINSFAFKDCSTLECLTFPKNITIISDYVLSGCTALTSVVFINGITNIGNSAFASCSSLPVVTLPETTTSIGANAFSSCSGLTSFTIPASITTIGANAFNNSINIATLLVQSKNVVSDIAEASSYGNLYNYATRVYFLDSLSPSPAGSYLTTNFTLQGSSDIGGYKLWLRNA
ncbi:MAG: leucine-rich repeat domain-containing protein, partial [Clostridia bacterium]